MDAFEIKRARFRGLSYVRCSRILSQLQRSSWKRISSARIVPSFDDARRRFEQRRRSRKSFKAWMHACCHVKVGGFPWVNWWKDDGEGRVGEIETARSSMGQYRAGHVMEQCIRLRTTRWNKAQRYGRCSGKANRGRLPSLRLETASNATGSPCRIVSRRCRST